MSTVPDHGLKEMVPVFGPEALGVGTQGSFQIGHQGIQVALFGQIGGAHFMRVEIAIRALFEAPGQMHIE